MKQKTMLIKDCILQLDRRKLTVNGYLCKSLVLVSTDTWNSDKMLSWWNYVKSNVWNMNRCRITVRLLLNTYRFGYESCKLCNNNQCDSVTHILFECNGFPSAREALWEQVVASSPQTLSIELRNMNSLKRCELLLNCLNCDIVPEWMELYDAICIYISTMYTDYMDSLNMIK